MTEEEGDDPILFHWPLRVYWEDTDAGGIVYYANYLRFLERARTEWLRSLGCEQRSLARSENVVFVVRSLQAEFLRPARLDDALIVAISRLRLGPGYVEMAQHVARDNERLFEAVVKLACVNISSFLPVRLPRSLRELLAARSPGRSQSE
jgi:acyl-CoA thioester hydrolase